MIRFSILMLALIFAGYSQYKARENVKMIKTSGDRIEKLSKELGSVVDEKLTGMTVACKELHNHRSPMLEAVNIKHTEGKSNITQVCFEEPDGEKLETIIAQTIFDELMKLNRQ